MAPVSLGAKVPYHLKEAFDELYEQHNRPQKGRMLCAMVKVFLRLPPDLQARLFSDPDASEGIEEVIQRLLDKALDERLGSKKEPEPPRTLDEAMAAIRKAVSDLRHVEGLTADNFVDVLEAVIEANPNFEIHRMQPALELVRKYISEYYGNLGTEQEFTVTEAEKYAMAALKEVFWTTPEEFDKAMHENGL